MSYPFVKAAAQYGTRKGPVKAFIVHMAEGGGTVGFLSRPNDRGVSVHYVVESTGRIVQMVKESDASGSINPADIRTTDDPDGFYGATVAKAVMGSWWKDPNSAAITCEVEGFAKTGPNAAQHGSLKTLIADVRSRFPGIGLLGHRDFQDYKACPGKLVHWDEIGGHGPFKPPVEENDVRFVNSNGYAVNSNKRLSAVAGDKWLYLDKSPGGTIEAPIELVVVGTGDSAPNQYVVQVPTEVPYPNDTIPRDTLLLFPTTRAPVTAKTTDCSGAVAAEHERVRAAAIAAVETL